MKSRPARSAITRKDVSLAMARLMPHLMRGVQLEFFLQQGVTQTQFLVLSSVRAYARCTMGALARNLHVSMPTTSGIVNRLVRDGFLHRAHEAGDRRQVIVELTPKALTFFHHFEIVLRRRWEEALLTLHPAELRALYDVTTKLTAQLQRQGGS